MKEEGKTKRKRVSKQDAKLRQFVAGSYRPERKIELTADQWLEYLTKINLEGKLEDIEAHYTNIRVKLEELSQSTRHPKLAKAAKDCLIAYAKLLHNAQELQETKDQYLQQKQQQADEQSHSKES